MWEMVAWYTPTDISVHELKKKSYILRSQINIPYSKEMKVLPLTETTLCSRTHGLDRLLI